MTRKYVYLVRAIVDEERAFYKIGIATDLYARFGNLKTASPLPLQLLFAFPSDRANHIEHALHQEYAHLRVRGEWFDDALFDELDAFFEECQFYQTDEPFESTPQLWRKRFTAGQPTTLVKMPTQLCAAVEL